MTAENACSFYLLGERDSSSVDFGSQVTAEHACSFPLPLGERDSSSVDFGSQVTADHASPLALEPAKKEPSYLWKVVVLK